MKSLLVMLLLLCGIGSVFADTPPKDERANVRTQLAAEYFRRGQMSVALDEARKAIAVNPKYAPAYNMLALIHMELHEYGKARDNFDMALSLVPGDPDTRHNYGYFLCDRGEYLAGINEYMTALRDPLYRGQEKTLVDAGSCAEKAGKDADALTYYQRALRFQTNSATAKYRLARLLLKAGKIPEARQYALELARAPKAQAEVLWLAILVERKVGNKEGEDAFSDQLRRLYPDSLESSKLLAKQYD